MKKLFAAVAFTTVFAAPAFAEEKDVLQVEVPMPASLTAEGAADQARADLLEASKKVCRFTRRRATSSVDAYISLGNFRNCVAETYTHALKEDTSGTLLASATAANDPYLVVAQ